MATVEVRNVRKAFGPVEVLHGVSVDIADGEFYFLVVDALCRYFHFRAGPTGIRQANGIGENISLDTKRLPQ